MEISRMESRQGERATHATRAVFKAGTPIDLPPPGERLPLGRLSISSSKSELCEPSDIARIIADAPAQMVFFADANMFIGPTNDLIWNALLSRQISITPLIVSELDSWIENPKVNRQAHSAFQK